MNGVSEACPMDGVQSERGGVLAGGTAGGGGGLLYF